MATTEQSTRTLSLDAAFAANETDGRAYARIRRELGVESFNVSALRVAEAGELLREHDETGPGADRNERVFVVIAGHATFTVDGQELDAPAGTVVHVPDPEAKRSAVATEPGTALLGIGGRPGLPYRPSPGEALAEYFPLHEAKDYEGAAAVAREVLGLYPGNGLALFNLACAEALLGQKDAAIEHVGQAVAAHESLRENARTDGDLDSLRGDPRFEELLA